MVPPGYISLLYSIGKKPLEYWTKDQSHTGKIRKTLDSNLLENVIEIQDLQKSNHSETSITCPARAWQLLDIPLPFLVIVIKNMHVQCRVKVQIVDADDIRHHFHFSNEPFESDPRIRGPVISRVGLSLESGWNRVELDLDDLTRKVFNSEYKATQRISICANCRLRRVYFVDRHYNEMDMSPELCKAFLDRYMIKRRIRPTSRGSMNTDHSKFLKKVQAKSGQLINDFFNRTLTNVDFDFKTKVRLIMAISSLGDRPEGTSLTEYDRKPRSGGVACVTPDGNGISVKPKRNQSLYKNRKALCGGERHFSIPKAVRGDSARKIRDYEALDQTLKRSLIKRDAEEGRICERKESLKTRRTRRIDASADTEMKTVRT